MLEGQAAKDRDGEHIDDDEVAKSLGKLYYDPASSGSYGGVDRLLRAAKKANIANINRDKVEKYLHDQYSYSLHKPARKHFERNQTYVRGIDSQWQADLADMQPLKRINNGARYLLTVIDIFSKYAWVVTVKDKTGKSLVKAFKQLFEQSKPRKPKRLQTDKGKEFLNREFKDYLKEQDVEHFTSNSDQKAAVVERFNRTLKHRIWNYFTANRTFRYVDVLDWFVNSYNNSFHRSIGMAPADVTPEQENKIWVRLYGDGGKAIGDAKHSRYLKKRQLHPGDKVRVSNVKGDFAKGYLPNWSEEGFEITTTDPKESKHKFSKQVYKIKDELGEPIQGSWYREELQPIRKNKYYVEKIIRKRKLPNGSEEFLVKWKGYSPKHNSWITKDDIDRR